jgi:NAD-dependent dihydropyrimidine dehydrogenase PreA subunit
MSHYRVQGGQLVEAGTLQIWLESMWLRIVGLAVRVFDKLIRYLNNRFGKPVLWLIARALERLIDTGEVVSLERAKAFIDAISVPGNSQIIVAPCRCQRALRQRKGTYIKCMYVLYGTEAYRRAESNYVDLTPEEAKELFQKLHDEGVMHVFLACMGSQEWFYVICGCESEICCEFKSHQVAGGLITAGPDIVVLDKEKCIGCGTCIERCHFGANSMVNGSSEVNLATCYGCGLCVSTCAGEARTLVERKDYHNRYYPLELVSKASAH